jgi:hypothetical protein
MNPLRGNSQTGKKQKQSAKRTAKCVVRDKEKRTAKCVVRDKEKRTAKCVVRVKE